MLPLRGRLSVGDSRPPDKDGSNFTVHCRVSRLASQLSNHLSRARQNIRGDCKSQLFRGFQVDHQLEVSGPPHGQIRRLGSL